ncbi:MAG: uridine kinase [Thermotogaceae bacterium]|nr:uridine kinase [Thermotogaceae bacterium]
MIFIFLIGIGGGTGSGKTTVARKIKEYVGEELCEILPMDNYYRDMSHIPLEERKTLNYDHPDMIEASLLLEHIKLLKENKPIKLPDYDFTIYTRKEEYIDFQPKDIIIIEGIFALYYKEICDLYDLKIYVDAESDVRFIRRLERDIVERGRTLDSVINQYLTMVKPMHDAYVEPTKRKADIIIPEGGFNEKAIQVIVEYINMRLRSE